MPQKIEALLSEQSGFVSFPMTAILRIVEDCERQLAAVNERMAQMQQAIDGLLDDTPIRDLPETQLERYAQTSPAWIFRWLVEAEERIAEMEASREWEPVENLSHEDPENDRRLDVEEKFLYMSDLEHGNCIGVILPDDLRLFRRRPQPQEAQA
jgi:hypothetical protein